MTEKQRSPWEGFLPKNAVIMAKRASRGVQAASASVAAPATSPTSHTHVVIGEGNPHARLVFVGEGPGEQEKAGQLLDKMIEAIGLKREDVYICNVVKCRSPGNRNPEPDEITLESIRPDLVVTLGQFATQTLLGTEVKITQERGQLHEWNGTRLMATYDPAYLLRNPESKKDAWADLQQVAKLLGLQIPTRKG